ncbi:MAG: helix-turn-helix domain-containing protein [Lachnospiraceae bacterium]|nr:helix-turn-helix domain-containing protein [Lachnospiraceae bacterium]
MEKQEWKTKQEFSSAVWKRIRKKLDEQHINQAKLRRMCEERGYKISQPELSRLYTEKTPISLYQITAFSEVLGCPVDYFVNESAQYHRFRLSGTSFITEPGDPAFEGYLGNSYFTYFHSTSPFENKILEGKLMFSASSDEEICEVLFRLDTGEKNRNGLPRVKTYEGQMVISTKLSTAFCLLSNEQIGEVSMVEFRHRSFLIKQAECRLGLVLTVSAGEKKHPVANRIFLSRQKLGKEKLEQIIPYLRLNSDEILVRRSEMDSLLSQEDRDGDRLNRILRYAPVEEYYTIDESTIRKGDKRMSRSERAKLMSFFLDLSTAEFQTSLREEDDALTYELLRESMDNS